MKLKSPKNKTVKVGLLSGHVINIPPEGREVPKRFLQAAFQAGCLPIEVDAEEVEKSASELDPGKAKERQGIIIDAIKRMLEDGEEMAASTGMPNLRDLSKLAGFTVHRNEMVDAWSILQDEADDNEDPDTKGDEQ